MSERKRKKYERVESRKRADAEKLKKILRAHLETIFGDYPDDLVCPNIQKGENFE